MIFIIDSQGTPKNVLYEPINQGSNNANQIVLFAPFPKASVVTASFTLANGIQTEPRPMLKLENDIDMQSMEGAMYNVWSVDIDAPITEYAGYVDVQFIIYLGNSKELGTYTSGFEVGKGVTGVLPKAPSIDVYSQICNYLVGINSNSEEAIDKAISYIRYIAPKEYLLNGEMLGLDNTSDISGDFTISGMNNYLDDDNLKNPNSEANKGDYFFKNHSSTNPNGFYVEFAEENEIGLVQAYVYQVKEPSKIQCQVSNNGYEWYPIDEKIISSGDFLEIVQFKATGDMMNIPARYVKLKQIDGSDLAYKGIEIYAPNVKGQYEIVRVNGNVSKIDTYDAEILVMIAEEVKANKDDAIRYLQSITDSANKVGGFPQLVDIGGQPKLPSVFINLANINDYHDITDESQLLTLDAKVGDVARLVIDVDNELGEKEVIKSFVKLSDGTWAVLGTSYADNAGNAEFAKESYNALSINGNTIGVYTQEEFDKLDTFPNISFVGI